MNKKVIKWIPVFIISAIAIFLIATIVDYKITNRHFSEFCNIPKDEKITVSQIKQYLSEDENKKIKLMQNSPDFFTISTKTNLLKWSCFCNMYIDADGNITSSKIVKYD
ncbi:hypothetical protein [Neisseria sp. Ec49-e6-T10]|uniref:hypothetical protein n=1 Tax=Neisseria sp. Ec49-e6-T10 TaxID=3140744 RepID=UPI003EBB61CD